MEYKYDFLASTQLLSASTSLGPLPSPLPDVSYSRRKMTRGLPVPKEFQRHLNMHLFECTGRIRNGTDSNFYVFVEVRQSSLHPILFHVGRGIQIQPMGSGQIPEW